MRKKADSVKAIKALPPAAGGVDRKTAIRFKTLADVRRFMSRTLNDLDGNKIDESKARCLGYLCSVLRDIIRDADLESRITKLEMEAAKNDNAR